LIPLFLVKLTFIQYTFGIRSMRKMIEEVETNMAYRWFLGYGFQSTTDSESGYYVKDERTKQFAYSFHAAADRNGFVLGTILTPGNIHDSQILEPLVEQVIEKVGKPVAVAADAAYKTPAITSYLFNKEIIPALPYTRPRTKEGFFRKQDYVYD
jgi:hypothetical protein